MKPIGRLTRRQRRVQAGIAVDAARKARRAEKRALRAGDAATIAAVCAKHRPGEWFKIHGMIFMGTGPKPFQAIDTSKLVQVNATFADPTAPAVTVADIQRAKDYLSARADEISRRVIMGEFIPP